jgi:hypothetical protein
MKKRFCLQLILSAACFGAVFAQNPVYIPYAAAMLDKMGVLYVGVDNPLSISCLWFSSENLELKMENATISKIGGGRYNVVVNSPGEAILYASNKDGLNQKIYFRAKRIPDPIPSLGARYSKSDTIEMDKFKAQMGIALVLENFDFDAKCDMVEYKITHIGTNHVDGKMFSHAVLNKGARFSTEASELISKGTPGDIFIFNEIKGRCPGDIKDRDLNALVFFMDEKE